MSEIVEVPSELDASLAAPNGGGYSQVQDELPCQVRSAADGLSIGLTFAIAKLFVIFAIGVQWADAPWLIGADILLGLVVGLSSRRFCHIAADAVLLIYLIDLHYASLFGGFLDTGALRFSNDAPLMLDSVTAIIDWRYFAGIAYLMILHRFLARRLQPWLAGARRQITASSTLLLVLLLVVVAIAGRSGEDRAIALDPLTAIAASCFERDAATPGSEPSAGESDAIAAFDGRTKFPFTTPKPPTIHASGGRKLNVVLILLESTGNVSRRRPGAETMPTFASLARKGVYFSNFYASTPMSIKSIFSVHSGRYDAANLMPITEVRPRIPGTMLPAHFKSRGYRTALLHGGYFEYTNKSALLEDRGYDLMLDGKSLPNREKFATTGWGIDDLAVYEYAHQWIDESPEPFFLTIVPILPHHPYAPPERWTKKFEGESDLDRYHNCLYFEDELIGGLVDQLKASGRFEQTVFVILGDHGEAFLQHPRNRVHSAEIYEENVNVPLLISNPVLFPESQTCRAVGFLGDLMPTLCDLLAFDQPDESIDGSSLFRKLGNEMVFFFTDLRESVLGLRDGDYKFIFRPARERCELYDLSLDPGESNDLSAANAERTLFYRKAVEQWRSYSIASINRTSGTLNESDAVDLTAFPRVVAAQSWRQLSVNKSVSGSPFRVGNRDYNVKGFGTHAESVIVFDVADYRGFVFRAEFGRDQKGAKVASPKGRVIGEVWMDGDVVFRSPPLTSRDAPISISIPVLGKRLSLVSLDGGDTRNGDHVDWLRPRLIKR